MSINKIQKRAIKAALAILIVLALCTVHLSAFLILVALVVHPIFLKFTPYRWVVASVTHPLTARRHRKRLAKMNLTTAAEYWRIYNDNDYWFKKYWFGRRMLNITENAVLSKHEEANKL